MVAAFAAAALLAGCAGNGADLGLAGEGRELPAAAVVDVVAAGAASVCDCVGELLCGAVAAMGAVLASVLGESEYNICDRSPFVAPATLLKLLRVVTLDEAVLARSSKTSWRACKCSGT
jgi:hypothetical protein